MEPRPSTSAERFGGAMASTRSQGRISRAFGSWEFFRLWIAQVISATGDWLGLLAIIALTADISEGSEGSAIALVLIVRVLPGLFFTPAAGLIVDRFDRKRLMILCDLGRAGVMLTLPFVNSLLGLVLASLVLEVLTMLWSPAKEAMVPNLVPTDKLTTANSLNVAAAYGMFPVAAGLAALLAKLAERLPDEGWVSSLHLNEQGLALYVDALTFLATAAIIATTALPRRPKGERGQAEGEPLDFGAAWRDIREGWEFIFANPVVRAVNVGLVTGIVGGGMLVPLGIIFVQELVAKSNVDVDADFNLMLFCLGLGMAAGVVTASVFQQRINRPRTFTLMLFVAGAALMVAASVGVLPVIVPAIAVLGFAAGPIYVLGFTLLHEHTEDELRGRVFSALLGLVRLTLLFALAIAPFLSELLDELSDTLFDREVEIFDLTIAIPGVRLTLWLAGMIILGAGVLASRSLRDADLAEPDVVETESAAT